jgi:hypothetical protein
MDPKVIKEFLATFGVPSTVSFDSPGTIKCAYVSFVR